MTRLKYGLAIFVAVSWFASPFLTYLLPTVSKWLSWIAPAGLIPLFVFFLSALFRRRWRAVTIFSATWMLASLSFVRFGPEERLQFWLLVQGFRIHVAPVEQYLSSCKLIKFTEDGIKQQLGMCETVIPSSNFRVTVFYDTTGQFSLPPAQRTQGWKDAMYNFSSYCYLTEKAVVDPVFEDFYMVLVTINHEGGC